MIQVWVETGRRQPPLPPRPSRVASVTVVWMRILQLSDLHFPDRGERMPDPAATPEAYLETLRAALALSSDLVVLSGDLALQKPSDHIYSTLRDLVADAGRPVVAIPGNHDVGGDLERWFPPPEDASRGPDACFAASFVGQRLVFIDSAPGVVSGAAVTWLRGQVTGATSRVYVFIHHPPLLAGVRFMDRNYPLANRDEVLTVLEGCGGGAAVFCGHYHAARDVVRGRVAVHIAPSTLFQIDPEPEDFVIRSLRPACRMVDIDGDAYRTWVHEIEPDG